MATVSEPQPQRAVVVGLADEEHLGRACGQQVLGRAPPGAVIVPDLDDWQGGPGVDLAHGRGGPPEGRTGGVDHPGQSPGPRDLAPLHVLAQRRPGPGPAHQSVEAVELVGEQSVEPGDEPKDPVVGTVQDVVPREGRGTEDRAQPPEVVVVEAAPPEQAHQARAGAGGDPGQGVGLGPRHRGRRRPRDLARDRARGQADPASRFPRRVGGHVDRSLDPAAEAPADCASWPVRCRLRPVELLRAVAAPGPAGAVADDDHVASGDTDLEGGAVVAAPRGDAQAEGERVLTGPADPDQVLVEELVAVLDDLGEPDDLTVRAVGVGRPPGLGAEHLLEQEQIAGRQA